MDIAEAYPIAEHLRTALEGACERIEIAGSIRRRRATVKDIELVAIPRWGERIPAPSEQLALGLEPPAPEPFNALQEAVEAYARDGHLQVIKPGTHEVIPWHLQPDGRYWRLWLPAEELKVDLFIATPDTWGLVYMIRTGSGIGPDGSPQHGFGPGMLQRWKAITGGGYAREARLWRPLHRTPEATPEEEDVFAACRVRFVPPTLRTERAVIDLYAVD